MVETSQVQTAGASLAGKEALLISSTLVRMGGCSGWGGPLWASVESDSATGSEEVIKLSLADALQHLGYTIPPHGNQRSEWHSSARFDFPNPEHR